MGGETTYQELQEAYAKATIGHEEPDIIIARDWGTALTLWMRYRGDVPRYLFPNGPGFSVR